MFMITWVSDENTKGKNKKEMEYQEAFKSVKVIGLTLEGAVFNKEFQMEDHPEKMIQSEGFLLKLSF
jgi:hypothetical protein